MTASTSRTHIDPTINVVHGASRWITARQRIWDEWSERGQPDMVATLREHPDLLSQKSLLMELAIDEYEARRDETPVADLSKYCNRFREFGSEVCSSIHHALEVQRHFAGEVTWPNIGDEWGGFQFIEQLGRGASARVYLCRETDLGYRQVVVKLSPHTSFEAAILGRLEHPNITPLYSAGTIADGNLNYLCMPFLGRSTLADLVEVAFRDGCPRTGEAIREAANRWATDDETALKPSLWRTWNSKLDSYVDGVLHVAIQIADALAYAHDNCILHGDLKPSNVLLTPKSQPVLLDFNLSRDFVAAEQTCGGTLPYMPPEHLRILAELRDDECDAEFTAASDIYSFGALLYELLAGVTPVANLDRCDIPSTAASRALDQLRRGVPAVRHRNLLVGRRLSALVSQCLAFDAADRPATMQELKSALQAERRSLAAAVRRARVRPLLFSLLVGVPIALATIGLSYVALRPASHVRNYERGLQLLDQNRPNDAAAYFVTALNADPGFSRARFELARARLAIGEIDLAMSEFHTLDKQESDLQSLAYLAYCFNVKRAPSPAIPLYERAIASGYRTLSVYNNLAACYIEGTNQLTPLGRLKAAESILARATALDPNSLQVHLNCIRLATKRAALDASFDPLSSWEHTEALLSEIKESPYIRWQLAAYWKRISDREAAKVRAGDQTTSDIESRLLDADTRQTLIAAFDAGMTNPNPGDANSPTNSSVTLTDIQACFIEPR